ncbi:MAG: MBOAT family protein [Clostridiales Family XIII bacterium]|jgi:D-alanyl-lipoteichoic acid acyltransferase DltB (MBOAT superfamily)|nr:MBOAT family protein [Clostridiales Family XIII bacterium]
MPFSSLSFFIFLAALGTTYFLIPKKYQWVLLLTGSYVFYLYSDVRLVMYILFSTISSYVGAHLVQRQNDALTQAPGGDNSTLVTKKKKLILILVLVSNFGILAYFKHLNALIGYANGVFDVTGVNFDFEKTSLILPLGISFYTFQSMGYLIDVYRGEFKPERNIARYALFVSFFPQLIQGPISRYSELGRQLYAPHFFDLARAKHGMLLMLWGFFKKLVIADRIAIITGSILAEGDPRGMYVVVLGVAYSFQIYADFSGGVDIARGVAQILGINLPHNFLRPYFAKTMPEFWRRWHVTLNNWWRDYIFYPVAFSNAFMKIGRYYRSRGKKKTAKYLPVYSSTMIVRVVNALWHGASVKYLANGVYNGLVIILGMQMEPAFGRLAKFLHIDTECFMWQIFRMVRTFFLVTVARLITVAPRFLVAVSMFLSLGDIFKPESGNSYRILYNGDLFDLTFHYRVWGVLFVCMAVWFVADILNEKGIVVRRALEKQRLAVQWIAILALVGAVALFGVYGPQYSSAAFIYQQF